MVTTIIVFLTEFVAQGKKVGKKMFTKLSQQLRKHHGTMEDVKTNSSNTEMFAIAIMLMFTFREVYLAIMLPHHDVWWLWGEVTLPLCCHTTKFGGCGVYCTRQVRLMLLPVLM